MKKVFHGREYRAQVEISNGIYVLCGETKLRGIRVGVRVLPQSMHPSTAFWRGDGVYYGASLMDALMKVRCYVESVPYPKKLADFYGDAAAIYEQHGVDPASWLTKECD